MDDLDLGQTLRGFSAGQKVFNRYTLTRLLGRGGMGVVWLARDVELERDVALKFLHEVVARDRGAIADLKRETRRALELTHSNVVRIYDFVTDGSLAAVSMEYVAGDSLANLRHDQPGSVFSAAKLTPWVEQLCQALDHAHRKAKIVHRDLKPANLMVDAHGDLKVTDFGISASIAESTTRVSQQSGSSGTPVYMSPQQMMGERPQSADDIYALGATLYELLTGKPPFYTGNIIAQVQSKVAPSITERRAELGVESVEPIPDSWETTIAACLAKDAAERPQSAGAVWARLQSESTEAQVSAAEQSSAEATQAAGTDTRAQPEPAAASVSSSTVSSVETSTRSPSSRKPLWLALAALVAIVLGAGWYFGVQVPEQRRQALIAQQEAEVRAAEAAKTKAEQERQAALAAHLAAARGGLIVKTDPAGAEVRVGSVAVEKSPVTLKELKLGTYPVKVSAPGYADRTFSVEVQEDQFTEPSLVRLEPLIGALAVESDPVNLEYTLESIRLLIANLPAVKRSGRTPVVFKDLPLGIYKVAVFRSGWEMQTHEFQINGQNAETWKPGFTEFNKLSSRQVEPAGVTSPQSQLASGNQLRERPKPDRKVRPAIFSENRMGTNNISPVSIDARWSNYGTYLKRLMDMIQMQWDTLLKANSSYPTHGFVVQIKFILNKAGEVSEVLIVDEGIASQIAVRWCVSSITNPAPYGKWTDEMVGMLGDEQEMTFAFYFQ